MPVRKSSGTRRATAASFRADRQQLDALDGDPEAQAALALTFVAASSDLDLLRASLAVVQAWADPAARPVLHAAYHRFERQPERSDSGGFIRAAIIRALRATIHGDDLPILQRALGTYQRVGLYDTTAELRAVALNALNDLDSGLAALHAARFLYDPENGNSGEPALSGLRVLVAQQSLAPVFAYAAWPGGNGELVGEALRLLVDIPASVVPLLMEAHRESDDEQVLLGLYDLLLGHPARAEFRSEIERFLRQTGHIDLYGLVAMQVVVSRDPELIAMLRALEAEERDHLRLSLLGQALQHA